MGAWLSTLVALTSLALGPDGKPAVAVLSVDGVSVPRAFVESMRIQLTSMASVDTGPSISGRSRVDKAAQARQYLLAVGASIAVWEEHRSRTETGKETVVVVAVARDPNGKPIEVAEIVTSGGPEDDRLLALKVGELLYQALATASSERELADELASRGLKTDSASTPRPERPTPAARPRPSRPAGSAPGQCQALPAGSP